MQRAAVAGFGSSAGVVDDEGAEGFAAGRGDGVVEAPVSDHDERGCGAGVDARFGFGQLVFLVWHLHVEHGEVEGDVGAADGLAVAAELQGEAVRGGGAVRLDETDRTDNVSTTQTDAAN